MSIKDWPVSERPREKLLAKGAHYLSDAELLAVILGGSGRRGSDAVSAAYEQNRQDAIAADVFGSPVYVLDGEVFWGQARIELLADALKSGRKPYSSEVSA